jgi:microcystin-dependent protein
LRHEFGHGRAQSPTLANRNAWEVRLSNPFIGEIRMFGGNFAPAGWAFCNGSLQSIANNDALFALIGTTYGGDGQNTFALPDLRGRVAVHQFQGPGLQNYVIGQQGGAESVTLLATQIPGHTHSAVTSTSPGQVPAPAATAILSDTGPDAAPAVPTYIPFDGTNQVTLATATVGASGGNQPHANIQPTLAINYIISLFGVFPARN